MEFQIRFRRLREFPKLRVGMFSKIVSGYFLLSRDTSRLSREASFALPFFCSLQCRSLCSIILNENEVDFRYSDKNIMSAAACALAFLVFFFHHPDLLDLGRV